MKILIIGSGGREHAIVRQVLKSNKVKKVFCAPGNAGIARDCECVSIPPKNSEMLIDFAIKNKIDLTIVGPELPLTLGIVDAFEEHHLKIFGPQKKAAIVECSKVFTKEFCARHNIPTAQYASFDNLQDAKAHIENLDRFPTVIKADGLASGKGVAICNQKDEAIKILNDYMLYEKFGDSGRKVVIEDFLVGEEASYIVMANGENFVSLASSQDHKAVYDDDKGPNTGGMGAYSPAPVVTKSVEKKILERIIIPSLKGLKAEDREYVGFLYAGLMIDKNGDPHLIEFNARLGDPETQVILPRLKTDFVELVEKTLEGKIENLKLQFEKGFRVGVVLASGGYPLSFEKGKLIKGLDSEFGKNSTLFHAGSKQTEQGFVTNGGRVLLVSSNGETLKKAILQVYEDVNKVSWDDMHFRKDIGNKGLKILQKEKDEN